MHFCNATRTFYEVKCSASHFPKENVQQSKMLQMHLMLLCFLHSKKQRQCKNVFDAKMYFCKAYIFQRENVQQRNASKTFLLVKCDRSLFFQKPKFSVRKQMFTFLLRKNLINFYFSQNQNLHWKKKRKPVIM